MSDFLEFLKNNSELIVAASALLTILLTIAGYISKTMRKLFSRAADLLFSFLPSVRHSNKLKKYIRKGPDEAPLWSYRRRGKLHRDNWPPIITVMNFKGGVGKTTLTGNIAASMAAKFGLSVWVLDLDYQGSLTAMARGVPPTDDEVVSNDNIMGDIFAATTKAEIAACRPVAFHDGFEAARIVTANHDLAEIEENTLQKWLLHVETPSGDVRSRLGHWFNSVGSEQGFPDIVLLDAPPRISLSAVNALIVSNFVIVPTIPQPASIEPVVKLLRRVKKLKLLLKSPVAVLGVVFNMTTHRFDVNDEQDDNVMRVRRAFREISASDNEGIDPVIFQSTIPRAAAISAPTTARLAYADPSSRANELREQFDQLAGEVLSKLRTHLPEKRIHSDLLNFEE